MQELFKELQATGTNAYLRTMHDITHVRSVVVLDQNGENPIDIPRNFTRSKIPVDSLQIPRPEILQTWQHLRLVLNHLARHSNNVGIGLLIGNNCPSTLELLKVVQSQNSGPYAVHLRHSWTINGPIEFRSSSKGSGIAYNQVSV